MFVAVEFSNPETLERIYEFQRELLSTGADIKLVERENLHFTIKFLGELPEGVVREVDSRLRQIKFRQINVTILGVGAFPSLSYPRVVWAGVEDKEGDLNNLAGLVLGALSNIGQEEQRGFSPHLTLCRVKSGRNKEGLIRKIEENSRKLFGAAEIKEIKLKSSILRPSGPVYSDVGVYPLE